MWFLPLLIVGTTVVLSIPVGFYLAKIIDGRYQPPRWLRGIEDVQKRYLVTLAGRNLTVLMRALFGVGTPRSLQGLPAAVVAAVYALILAVSHLHTTVRQVVVSLVGHSRQWLHGLRRAPVTTETRPCSTGC